MKNFFIVAFLFSVAVFPWGGIVAAHAQTGSPVTSAGTGVPASNAGTGAPVTSAGTGCTGANCLINPLNAPDLSTLVQELLNYAVKIGTIFLTIMLIYVGFLFVAARGNDAKIKSARQALLWTVVGGLLLLGATAIATAISTTVSSL